MDQLATSSFLRSEQLGSSYNMEANVPALLAAASNAASDYTSSYGHDHHDILQFYPSASHYLAVSNPYSHFSRSTFLPLPQEYYLPTLLDENMASFGATSYAQLGLNSLKYGGYYLPPRGGYAYGHHTLRCQVDGCTADLSKAKRYHRRHRVCEHHSKAPVVITARAIMPQRFCQQCSRILSSLCFSTLTLSFRFHEVDEFDDMKKSCRQRLADHNRRRRKLKPSNTDVTLKRRARMKKSATTKDKGSSSRNMGAGSVLGTQELENASKEHYLRSMDLGEVMREPVDSKEKARMKQQARIPLLSSLDNGTYCLPHSQTVSSGGNTSNIAQEPGLGVHQDCYHQRATSCSWGLGHAVFDLDLDH
ncbi:hypothetical protein PR202_ga20441 [Eleusine coracana subsp. coracana]|uniref:SBP-type domain-containing protein n=1 Tax=Eleusine coracana subsp. coracana TaxID=191504 RepID=A0AAV5CXD8_ELECO|nr:hypothetical protein PR202_ga20441 [Eleusine coracana subsp. coracana]